MAYLCDFQKFLLFICCNSPNYNYFKKIKII
nr:MAG TPA: hypothetical protein [Caudoviricetes sp.]